MAEGRFDVIAADAEVVTADGLRIGNVTRADTIHIEVAMGLLFRHIYAIRREHIERVANGTVLLRLTMEELRAGNLIEP